MWEATERSGATVDYTEKMPSIPEQAYLVYVYIHIYIQENE